MTDDVNRSAAPEYPAVADDYANFSAFADEHPDINYFRFDWSCVHELNLFALRETVDFDSILRLTDMIVEALPSIKRILSHPTMYLKVTEEIVPVESVQIINNRTLEHATVHSELWENMTDDGLLIPRRLLTLKNQDEYAIYENTALTWLLFRILSWLRRNISICKDLLYADRVLDMNVLGRNDHLYHYLAIGKIHTGYIRGFDKYRDIAERCLNRLMYLYNTLSGRMGSPLVKACRTRIEGFTLHRSNLFRMHRDYRTVYGLCKVFAELKETEVNEEQDSISREGYAAFCHAITIFAAGHFNFTADTDAVFSLRTPEINFSFAGWALNLHTVKTNLGLSGLLMTIRKDTEYRILLVPMPVTDKTAERSRKVHDVLRSICTADEYIILSDDPDHGGCRVSLSDIESFRRIQQLILRGMVCSDRTFDVCPFCGHPLKEEQDSSAHVCSSCQTRIEKRSCPDSGLSYMATSIDNQTLSLTEPSEDIARKSAWVYDRIAEGRMHFRNITPITAACDIICPHCGKIHM